MLEKLLILLEIILKFIYCLSCDFIKLIFLLTNWSYSFSWKIFGFFWSILNIHHFLFLLFFFFFFILFFFVFWLVCTLVLFFLFDLFIVFDHYLGDFSLFLFDKVKEFLVIFIIRHIFFRLRLFLHSSLFILKDLFFNVNQSFPCLPLNPIFLLFSSCLTLFTIKCLFRNDI